MDDFRIEQNDMQVYPLGVTVTDNGVHFSVASAADSCRLLLFMKGRRENVTALSFSEEEKVGTVWNMTVVGDFSGVSYCYEFDGIRVADPYGQNLTGREKWGSLKNVCQVLHAAVEKDDFDWEGDRPLELPFENCVLYRLHPRGFTKHASSQVENRGTFSGIMEKLPYLKELGVTTVELFPATEFQEVMLRGPIDRNPYMKEQEPTGRLNYWGFTPGEYFSPKESYCSGKEKQGKQEFKQLVKAFHKAGLELIMDFFFSGKENESYVLDVLRFWAREYHVDGFHLVGFAPCHLIGSDPYLSRVKLFAPSWDGVPAGKFRHLAEYREDFSIDMRRLLKGDEDQINNLVFRTRHNPVEYATVNYMANANGFTLADNVCYDVKHNEANGENNQDGNDYNYSWNCGVEGPTRKKKVVEMRKKLLRNSLLLVFLSQGVPLLLSGDEFGNTKNGNNNSYCQDNEISWLNWNQAKTNADLLEFAKFVIRFRKAHPVFHMPKEPRVMDYLSCGQPDVSYHGVKAWCPEFENFRRQLGIMYCGKYGKKPDGTEDNYFFVAYNLHWEPHEFSLPNLPKPLRWHVAINTDAKQVNGIYPEGEEPLLEKQKVFLIPPRTIVVFIGKEGPVEASVKGSKKKGSKKAKKSGKAVKAVEAEAVEAVVAEAAEGAVEVAGNETAEAAGSEAAEAVEASVESAVAVPKKGISAPETE